MNYKVAKTMLILCIVYLVGFYILKFFFPELLLQTITSPILIKFGEFINSWIGYTYIFRSITTFITFYLFYCASSGSFKLNLLSFVVFIVLITINNLVLDFLPELYTHTSIVSMFVCAVISKGKLIYATIAFGIHGYLSQFLLSIRGFETIIIYINSLSGFVIGLEVQVWLILLAIIFNIKENKNYGDVGSTLCK